jgi:hypothetical protein
MWKWLGLASAVSLMMMSTAYADNYSDTIAVFKRSGASAAYFHHSYAYAVPLMCPRALRPGSTHKELTRVRSIDALTASPWRS